MKFHLSDRIRIVLPQAALDTVFDECDRFDHEETGGRILGTYKKHRGSLEIQVRGVIEAGPAARRTAVSFFQDGEHQEAVFRRIEQHHPEIEHVGNWHTHHMNGLPHLSAGDVETYFRIVNHANQNTPFFYALLVVAKANSRQSQQRYVVKHYILYRDDPQVYEISEKAIEIVKTPLLEPVDTLPSLKPDSYHSESAAGEQAGRVYDRDLLGEFFPGLRPYTSPKIAFYWRGYIDLLDGTKVEVVLTENPGTPPTYTLLFRGLPEVLKPLADELAERDFPSARVALIETERRCNRVFFERYRHLPDRKAKT